MVAIAVHGDKSKGDDQGAPDHAKAAVGQQLGEAFAKALGLDASVSPEDGAALIDALSRANPFFDDDDGDDEGEEDEPDGS